MNCPKCGRQNSSTNKFCMNCGILLRLPGDIQSLKKSQTEPLNARRQYPDTLQNNYSQQYNPRSHHEMTDRRPSTVGQPEYVSNQPLKQPKPSFTQPSGSSNQQNTYSLYYPDNQSAMNIWGPFAGYGMRYKHIGWLMDDKGTYSQTLIQKVSNKFRERNIPNAEIKYETLTARGVLVENRPYFLIKQGLVSIALYITEFGKDLFISLASYLKPPLSNFRILVFGGMILFYIIMLASYGKMLTNSIMSMLNQSIFGGESGGSDSIFFLLCFIGPLILLDQIALLAFIIMGIYKWMTQKDFWFLLRVPPNEFNEDDLMAMEKAVEHTLNISLVEINLNANDLKQVYIKNGK